VRKGERLGEVRVLDGEEVVATRPLVAAETIERPGAAGRARWYAGETLSNVWWLVS
jgi:hypothetical protein